MGYYINPENGTKEEWLSKNARSISYCEADKWDFGTTELPVCLVDNGMFTAAGIGYHPREVEAFRYDDGRRKKWFAASREALKPFYSK